MNRIFAPFDDSGAGLRGKAIGLFVFLILLNLFAWAGALAVFRDRPLLIGTALLAYSFGLRHAFDVDHIAVIDNVTRKLMQEGKRPLGAGFFFSLGHSTVVVVLTLLIALAASTIQFHFAALREVGSVIGTSVSAAFLLLVAAVNMFVLVAVWRRFRAARRGEAVTDDAHGAPHGMLAWLLRRPLGLIGRSWHMYPLGILFGLGFDTATEVGLLGLSATEAAKGLPVWAVLLFPLLFTAAMSLIDTIDGVVMLGAYGWAFVEPRRKLTYNLVITALSVLLAFGVGLVEVAGLLADRFGLTGGVWRAVAAVSGQFTFLGYLTVGIFVCGWAVSMAVTRLKGAGKLDNPAAAK